MWGGGAFCSWLRRCAFSSLVQSENKKCRPLAGCAAFIRSCWRDDGAGAPIIVNIFSLHVFNMLVAVCCHFLHSQHIESRQWTGFNLHKLKIRRSLGDVPTGGLCLATRAGHGGVFASAELTQEPELKGNLNDCEGIHVGGFDSDDCSQQCSFYLWISGSKSTFAGTSSEQNQRNKEQRVAPRWSR